MGRNTDRLTAVLKEHEALRNEIVGKSRLHVTVFAAYISFLGIFYGYVVANKAYDLIVIVPWISLGLLERIIWDQLIISEISRYIKYEIEQQKIPLLLGKINPARSDEIDHKFSNLWLGWQTSYYLNKDRLPYFYEISLKMLFVVLSSVPPILFNLYNIIVYCTYNTYIELPLRSYLPVQWNIIFFAMDYCLALYTLYLIRIHIVGRRDGWKP